MLAVTVTAPTVSTPRSTHADAVAAVLEPAAAQLGALGQPDQAETGAGRRGRPNPTGLRSSTAMPSSGEPLSAIVSVEPGRVLAGVGDALLHDPVDRPPDRVRHRRVGGQPSSR